MSLELCLACQKPLAEGDERESMYDDGGDSGPAHAACYWRAEAAKLSTLVTQYAKAAADNDEGGRKASGRNVLLANRAKMAEDQLNEAVAIEREKCALWCDGIAGEIRWLEMRINRIADGIRLKAHHGHGETESERITRLARNRRF